MASGIETIERASRFRPRSSLTALPPRAGLTLAHPARELVHVEIVPPGVDLATADLEGAHDRQLERLVGELEDVHPLRHHDRAISCDVDDAEIDALDAWRARAQDRSDRVGDVLPAGDRRLRDVVVYAVLGEECCQLDCSHVVGPRGAKPAHHLDRGFHLALLWSSFGDGQGWAASRRAPEKCPGSNCNSCENARRARVFTT